MKKEKFPMKYMPEKVYHKVQFKNPSANQTYGGQGQAINRIISGRAN